MYVVDTALLNVIKVLMNTLQVAGEAVRVEEHSEKIISLIPVRDEASGVIPLLQYIRSLLIVLIHHLAEVIKCCLVIVVELGVKPFHLIIVNVKTFYELRIPTLIDHFFPPNAVKCNIIFVHIAIT